MKNILFGIIIFLGLIGFRTIAQGYNDMPQVKAKDYSDVRSYIEQQKAVEKGLREGRVVQMDGDSVVITSDGTLYMLGNVTPEMRVDQLNHYRDRMKHREANVQDEIDRNQARRIEEIKAQAMRDYLIAESLAYGERNNTESTPELPTLIGSDSGGDVTVQGSTTNVTANGGAGGNATGGSIGNITNTNRNNNTSTNSNVNRNNNTNTNKSTNINQNNNTNNNSGSGNGHKQYKSHDNNGLGNGGDSPSEGNNEQTNPGHGNGNGKNK